MHLGNLLSIYNLIGLVGSLGCCFSGKKYCKINIWFHVAILWFPHPGYKPVCFSISLPWETKR